MGQERVMGKCIANSDLNAPVVGAMLASVAAGSTIWIALYMVYRWAGG